MKNKFLLIILSVALSLPVAVWAADNDLQSQEQAPAINTLDEDKDLITEEEKFKQPISKKKIAKKFLAAMGGVAVSSFTIFFILTAYNRIREGFEKSVKTADGDVSLETPDNISQAIRTFLDKTKW